MSSVPLSSSQKRSLASATEEYHSQLDDQALAYLETRGLGSSHAIETLRLGLVHSPRPEHTRFRGRLAIPYIGPRGNVYAMVFRCIQQHDCKEADCRKYDYPVGQRRMMYNTRALVAPTDYLLVTEGELDAATLTICGWPAVGVPGATQWKPHFARMMGGFQKVVLIADGDVRKDEKTETASEKLQGTFTRALPSVGRVIVCKPGDDINSLFVREGKEGIQKMLKQGEDDE